MRIENLLPKYGFEDSRIIFWIVFGRMKSKDCISL